MVAASAPRPTSPPRLGAHAVFAPPATALIEALGAWSGGVLRPTWRAAPDVPPRRRRRRLRHRRPPETLEVGLRVLVAGTLVKSGVATPGRWEWTPLYFKEISLVGSNAFGVEEVEGVRQHGIAHYLDLAAGPVDLTGLVTHTFAVGWRDAFAALADQAHRRRQGRPRPRPPTLPAAPSDPPPRPLTADEIATAVAAVRATGAPATPLGSRP